MSEIRSILQFHNIDVHLLLAFIRPARSAGIEATFDSRVHGIELINAIIELEFGLAASIKPSNAQDFGWAASIKLGQEK